MIDAVYQTCPKCGHARSTSDTAPAGQCPACGVVFEKWLRSQLRGAGHAREQGADGAPAHASALLAGVGALLMHVEARVNPVEFWARALAWAVLAVWGAWFIGTDWASEVGPSREIGESFMHRVNLVFHEAGHVLFIPLGDFMSVLGGSLGQLLMPLVVAVVFLFRHHNAFGASVAVWWLAQSLMDLAPYIGDARRRELMLLGGITGRDAPGYHDWSNLLGRTGLLHRDRAFAAAVDFAGEALMCMALAWGAALLLRQYRNVDWRI